MKEITGAGLSAEPWEKGRVVVGVLTKAEELPGCESKKLTFADVVTGNPSCAVWETAAIRALNLIVGTPYKLECLGMVKFKRGEGWGFKAFELDQKDIADIIAKHIPASLPVSEVANEHH